MARQRATSELPGHGGLDPAVGVNLTYFVDRNGFSRAMLPIDRPGPPELVWIEGLFTLKDRGGRERLLAVYTRQAGLVPPDERGIALFDDEKQEFQVLATLPLGLNVSSHPFRVTVEGKHYWYFAPNGRVPDDWSAVTDPMQYESYTCLQPGARFEEANPRLERRRTGELAWGWKPNTDWIDADEEIKLIRRGLMKKQEALFPLLDADSGVQTGARPDSIAWNAYRQKWILLAEHIGNIYYAEADEPTGPWLRAKKILGHQAYNFYNVVQHSFFDQEGGRIIYFEGTYTTSFSDAKQETPRYNYNQIMYRLRLDDPRLRTAETHALVVPASG